MNLFKLQIPSSRQHHAFARMLEDAFAPERAVLTDWAKGFVDRDGKFVKEFQMTFESGLWELYLNACLRHMGNTVDMSHHSPDFVVTEPNKFLVEATIAAPPQGGKTASGYLASDIPEDFNEFNVAATIRICNSFGAKVKRYRNYYSSMAHVAGLPFVIAIAAFDRPLAHFAASRPILAAIYGLYHDEEETLATGSSNVVSYNVSGAMKSATTEIPVGLFCDDTYSEVSAVIYSSLATWGKIRAMADSPDAATIYKTFHPSDMGLAPEIRTRLKKDYQEHLLDGIYVLHNPFAKNPLPLGAISHERIIEVKISADGEMLFTAPDDALLVRTLFSVVTRD